LPRNEKIQTIIENARFNVKIKKSWVLLSPISSNYQEMPLWFLGCKIAKRKKMVKKLR